MHPLIRTYIGLGSNLNNPQRQIEQALTALTHLLNTKFIGVSSLHHSKPLGPQNQPDFVNAVAALETELSPEALLAALQAIENQQGRVRTSERWGPRTLDLDILLYGDQVIQTPVLTIPHPGLATREFWLIPLAELNKIIDKRSNDTES